MSAIGLTAAQINLRHQAFWNSQSEVMMERLKDAAICELACVLMKSEQHRCVPAFYQMTLECALEKAAVAHRRFTTERARRAGSCEKTDPLQTIIERVVAKNPMINAAQLQAKLTREQHPEVIEDVDEDQIAFRIHDGRTKVAKLSGLRDRLYRAKKKLRAR